MPVEELLNVFIAFFFHLQYSVLLYCDTIYSVKNHLMDPRTKKGNEVIIYLCVNIFFLLYLLLKFIEVKLKVNYFACILYYYVYSTVYSLYI